MEKLSKRNESNKVSQSMICYFSEKGHNNFFYPTSKKGVLKDGCEYDELNWVSGNRNLNLKAIKVKNNCVLPLTITSLDDKDILSTENNYYIVVWVDKKV